MSNCAFSDSYYSNADLCDKCEERKIHLCRIYEGRNLSTEEIFSTYKNTCKKAVFIREDSLNRYKCGKNGGICDVFRFKTCKRKEDFMPGLFSDEDLKQERI